MNCEQAKLKLSALLDNEIGENDVASTLSHLESCYQCRSEYIELLSLQKKIKGVNIPEPKKEWYEKFHKNIFRKSSGIIGKIFFFASYLALFIYALFHLFTSTDNEISNNTFINVQFTVIYLLSSSHNYILYNKILSDMIPGFRTGIAIVQSQFNELKRNYISGGYTYGLYLDKTRFTEIKNNNFSENKVSIRLFGVFDDDFKYNNIERSQSGIELFATLSIFSASYNFWGDWKGPFFKVFPLWYIIFCIPWSFTRY